MAKKRVRTYTMRMGSRPEQLVCAVDGAFSAAVFSNSRSRKGSLLEMSDMTASQVDGQPVTPKRAAEVIAAGGGSPVTVESKSGVVVIDRNKVSMVSKPFSDGRYVVDVGGSRLLVPSDGSPPMRQDDFFPPEDRGDLVKDAAIPYAWRRHPTRNGPVKVPLPITVTGQYDGAEMRMDFFDRRIQTGGRVSMRHVDAVLRPVGEGERKAAAVAAVGGALVALMGAGEDLQSHLDAPSVTRCKIGGEEYELALRKNGAFASDTNPYSKWPGATIHTKGGAVIKADSAVLHDWVLDNGLLGEGVLKGPHGAYNPQAAAIVRAGETVTAVASRAGAVMRIEHCEPLQIPKGWLEFMGPVESESPDAPNTMVFFDPEAPVRVVQGDSFGTDCPYGSGVTVGHGPRAAAPFAMVPDSNYIFTALAHRLSGAKKHNKSHAPAP